MAYRQGRGTQSQRPCTGPRSIHHLRCTREGSRRGGGAVRVINFWSISISSGFPSPRGPAPNKHSWLWTGLSWTVRTGGIRWCGVLRAWLLPLRMFSRLSHIVLQSFRRTNDLPPCGHDSVLFICSSVDGHWGRVHLVAVVHKAALNCHVQEFVWMCVPLSGVGSLTFS